MTQKLQALILIIMEQHIFTEIDIEDVIKEFSVLILGKRKLEL